MAEWLVAHDVAEVVMESTAQMRTPAADGEQSFYGTVVVYFGDVVFGSRRLLAMYDELLPQIDRALRRLERNPTIPRLTGQQELVKSWAYRYRYSVRMRSSTLGDT